MNARVHEVDLLRFVAALAVVFYHYSFRGYAADGMCTMPYLLLVPLSKYGYMGVDLFFMISGFVIIMTAKGGSLRGFVISRVVRLYPAFWACCSITYAVSIIARDPQYSSSLGQYFLNMTMLSEFIGVPSIDGVYWSLFIEIRFYVLVAIVLALGKMSRAQTFLYCWMIVSIVLEAFPVSRLLQNLLIVDYAAYFIGGAAYYLIWSQGISPGRTLLVASSLGLALFQSLGRARMQEAHYHVAMSVYGVGLIIVSFYFLMLVIALKRTGWLGRRSWLTVGGMTYPLYLIHQNIGFAIINSLYPGISAHILLWGTVVIMLCAAYGIHAGIEKRVQHPMKRWIGQRMPDIGRLFKHSWDYRAAQGER